MNNKRTGGMTAIAIVNIVLGAIGTLMALLVVVGGGLLAAGGAAMQADGNSDTAAMGSAAAAGGGLIMIMGVVGLLCWACIAISGIGILKLAPWGRTLSMVCGGLIALLNLYSVATAGFNPLTLAFLLYGGLLVGLFCMPEWKAAFTGGQSSSSASHSSHESSSYRRAA